jgi:TRAP-type C4-dicarboxylate transport system permease small subunit
MQWFSLKRWLTIFTQWVALFGLILLLILALFILSDVIMRWLFNAPYAGVLDISQLLLPVIVSTCFPIAVLQRHHITIRFLGKAAGPRGETWLECFGSLVFLLFLTLVAWQFILHTADMQAAGEHTWVIQLPMAPWWWITTAMMTSCVPLQGLIVVSHFVRAVTGRIAEQSLGDTPEL